MSTFSNDFKYSLRMLAKQPSFAVIIIGILTIGVAGSVTMFSVFNELLLRPLPVPHSERVVDLDETAPHWNLEYTGICLADFTMWRKHNHSFDSMAVWIRDGRNLACDGRVERVSVLRASYGVFDVLGIRPARGRCFDQTDDQLSAPKVVLLSHDLWTRIYHKDLKVLGQSLNLDSELHTIIGVLPPKANFPTKTDLWKPLQEEVNPEKHCLNGCARLKQGISLKQAHEDLVHIQRGMRDVQANNDIVMPRLTDLRQRYLGDYYALVSILMAVAGFVLLIACCNVTGIMLARGTYRNQEITIRTALGASQLHIIRQILTESLVLALIGGVLGFLMSQRALVLLLALMSNHMAPWMTFSLDIRIILFCGLIIIVVTLFSGLIPACYAGRSHHLFGILQATGSRGSDSRARRKTLDVIVIGEIALALILLIGAALLGRAFNRVQHTNPGFRTSGILTYRIAIPNTQWETSEQGYSFFEQLIEKTAVLPGVDCAAMASTCPLSGRQGSRLFRIEGPIQPGPDDLDPIVIINTVTSNYFEAMGIKLLAGRHFFEQDISGQGERTVMVNETFARHFWPDGLALGKRIANRDMDNWQRVIGVIRDVKQSGLEQQTVPEVYVPYSPRSQEWPRYGIVRTSGDPLALAGPIREIVQSLEPDLPVHDVQTMSDRVRNSMWLRRTYSWIFGVFAGIAMALAVGGIYGVTFYAVSQRTQEMGIRLALGARPRDVSFHVMKQGLRLISLGLVIGWTGSFVLSRMLSGFLFGVAPSDLLTFTTVAGILGIVALLACYIPARRAAKTDPMEALRYE